MKKLDKEIYDVLSKYIDMNYVEYYDNVVGIEVAKYILPFDWQYDLIAELKSIGFDFYIGYNGLYFSSCNEEYLCGISYCEHDIFVVYYKDKEQMESEKKRALDDEE